MTKQLEETLAANARLSVHATQKRKRVQKGSEELLSKEDLERIRVEKANAAKQLRVVDTNGDRGKPSVRKGRRCGMCTQTGHTRNKCPNIILKDLTIDPQLLSM